MTSKLTATFETRRDAELVIERLVQELGVDRSAIRVGPDGENNSSGEDVSGGDAKAAEPSVEERDDGALESRIRVSVDLEGSAASDVRRAFKEFDGEPPTAG